MASTLDPELIPAGPHLVAPFRPALAGVDYLNLRQVNLDLMGECMPGTNNSTRHVRGYSLIVWIYWIYPRLLQSLGRENAERQELVHFREKVESLFVWSHQLESFQGVPGISSKPPEEQDGRIDLRFKAWKRSRNNTSLEAAVWYGPSLALDGIGLLEKIDQGLYVVTPAGADLAAALDESLRKSSAYRFLTDLTDFYGTEELANSLFPCWRIDETSDTEAAVFRSALWQPEHADAPTSTGRRADMISLLLDLLSTPSGPQDLSSVRRQLALPGTILPRPMSSGKRRQSRSWLFLQLRQLQRQSMEAIMSWLECRLFEGGQQLPDDLVEKAVNDICRDADGEQIFDPHATIADTLALIQGPFQSVPNFQRHVLSDPDWCSPWSLIGEIREWVFGEHPASIHSAFYSMLFLYQCKPFLEADETMAIHLARGEATRQSLSHWFGIIDRLLSKPLRLLIDWTLKNLVISQHLAVGTQRFDGEKIRLRMILEEDGIETLVIRCWRPEPTPDRLEALLNLMVSCHLLTVDHEGRYYSHPLNDIAPSGN